MEKYVLGGSRGSGTTRTKVFSLEVVAPTTTSTTTTTTVAYEDDDGHYDYAEDSDEEDQDESYEEEEEEDDSDEDDHEEDEYLEYDATTTTAVPTAAVPTTLFSTSWHPTDSTDTTSHYSTSWHPDQEQRGDTGPEYTEYQEYSDHSDNSTAELDYAESSRLQVEEVRDVTLLEEVSMMERSSLYNVSAGHLRSLHRGRGLRPPGGAGGRRGRGGRAARLAQVDIYTNIYTDIISISDCKYI